MGNILFGKEWNETKESVVGEMEEKRKEEEEDPFANFGASFGKEIENKNTILSEIDAKLGRTKPPAIEYIFCEPFGYVNLFGFLTLPVKISKKNV